MDEKLTFKNLFSKKSIQTFWAEGFMARSIFIGLAILSISNGIWGTDNWVSAVVGEAVGITFYASVVLNAQTRQLLSKKESTH
jgi:hypothetical protein